MNGSLITIVLTCVAIFGAIFFVSFYVDIRAKRIVGDDIKEKEFRASNVLNIMMYLSLSMPALMIYFGYEMRPIGWVFPGVIGYIFLIGNLIGIILLKKVKVTLSDDELVYENGLKKNVLSFSEIRNIWVANYHICIDIGSRKHFIIPLMFKNNYKLVALLKSIASNNLSESKRERENSN